MDVCKCLDITNTTQAVQGLEQDEATLCSTESNHPPTNYVNERGLRSMVGRSTNPKAAEFLTWLDSEVMPKLKCTALTPIDPIIPHIGDMPKGKGLTMSSREIADLTGKQHKHVCRDIVTMMGELGEDVSRFGCIYLDSMNRQQTEYLLPKDLTLTLVSGYNTRLRHKIIHRWMDLAISKFSNSAERAFLTFRCTLHNRT